MQNPLRTLAERVDPAHTAVLVVDVQNDFCHDEGACARNGLSVKASQEMVPRLARLLDGARKAGAYVVFIRVAHGRHTSSPVWATRGEQRRADPEAPRVPVTAEGTWGAEFYEIGPQGDEPVVTKHRYSAFVDTPLDLILRSQEIRTLVMTGVATNICVESTARDGYQRDYHVVFLDDCTATFERQDHEATLRNIRYGFGVVSTSTAVLEAWGVTNDEGRTTKDGSQLVSRLP